MIIESSQSEDSMVYPCRDYFTVTYVASARDVTSLLGTDDLIKHQNEFVSFHQDCFACT